MSAKSQNMNGKIGIFAIIALLFILSCTSHSEKHSSCEKAWAVTKGDSKESVRKFMESQKFTITDEDSVLIAFDIGGICWCGEKWDMASVKFDTNKKAKSVSLVRGEPFSDLAMNGVVNFLESVYGTSEYDQDLSTWTFRGDEQTNAFIAQYPRSMIDVTWDISKK